MGNRLGKHWGTLAERYEELDRTHRLLSLDGGGIRGLLTLEILAEVERQAGDRLCRYFDYVGGTSTGAIIAAAIARGMTVDQIRTFYVNAGPQMFEPSKLWRRHRNFYKRDPLANELKKVLGAGHTLRPDDLECLVMLVMKNASTDSPWPLSSNPDARYNDLKHRQCNLRIPLWRLVRASTAAPAYFPPEIVQLDANDDQSIHVFEDGGISPYNNPAFLLYRMASIPEYKLGWPTGENKLMVLSLGTGNAPDVDPTLSGEGRNIVDNAKLIPGLLMYAASVEQDVACRSVGRCVAGAPIDRELGDMIPKDQAGNPKPLTQDSGRAFRYARYDADISQDGLEKLGLGDIESENVSKLDSIEHIGDLSRIGQRVAQDVDLSCFGDLGKS